MSDQDNDTKRPTFAEALTANLTGEKADKSEDAPKAERPDLRSALTTAYTERD